MPLKSITLDHVVMADILSEINDLLDHDRIHGYDSKEVAAALVFAGARLALDCAPTTTEAMAVVEVAKQLALEFVDNERKNTIN